jgi:hypothetical protein
LPNSLRHAVRNIKRVYAKYKTMERGQKFAVVRQNEHTEVNHMEAKDYCRNMEMELTTWKAKLYDIIRKFDQLPTGEKERAYEDVNDLHMLMTEMEDRLDNLRESCPTGWKPQDEKELTGKLGALEDQYKKLAEAKFDYEFGG